jgi:hypothetical protein
MNIKMTQNREQEALSAYLKLLKNKGVDEDSLARRQDFLTKLFPVIGTIAYEGLAYRAAVELVLNGISKREWPLSLAVAREYFHFWIKDFKAIAALNADAEFDVDLIDWQPIDLDLKQLWPTLDNTRLSTVETWPIKAYALALRQTGAEQTLVDMRVKLVKILLVRLREAPLQSNKHYRIAVDATVPLFEKSDTRRLFFAVVREFYYFWIGDPDAASHVAQSCEASSFV